MSEDVKQTDPAPQPKTEIEPKPETVPYARFSEKVAEYKAVKKELEATGQKLTQLESALATKEGEAGKLLEQYRNEADAARRELTALRVDSTLRDSLLHAGATGATLGHATTLARAFVQVDERGAVLGVEEAVAKLKADLPALFAITQKAPSGHTGGAADGGDAVAEQRRQLQDAIALAKRNGQSIEVAKLFQKLQALDSA